MRLKSIALLSGIALFGLSLTVRAGTSLSDHPGFLDFRAMGFFDHGEPSVDVSLDGPLLRLLASAVPDDEEAGEVLNLLEAVRVHVMPIAGEGADHFLKQMNELSSWMDKGGWERIVRVREKSESVDVYLHTNGKVISGVTVMVVEPGDEAVLVNIAGEFDMSKLGNLMKLHGGHGLNFDIDAGTLTKIEKEMRRKYGSDSDD